MDPEKKDNEYEYEDNTNETITDESNTTEEPEWKKKFESPDKMWDSYRSLQSEYTKLKQKIESEKQDIEEGIEDINDSINEVNPDNFLEQVIESKINTEIGDVIEYVNEQRINQVINEVHKVFPDFDFEKEGDALAEELAKYNEEYKRKYPVEATIKAIASMKGIKSIGNTDESILDKIRNFSEGVTGRMPPKKADEVEEIIRAKNNTLPF